MSLTFGRYLVSHNLLNVMQNKYLFFYLKTGGGHLAPARSVANHIHTRYGDKARVTLADGFAGVNKLVKVAVEDGYRRSQSNAVWVFEALYAINKLKVLAIVTAFIISYFVKPHLKRQILAERPSKIVIFHFFLIRPVLEIVKEYNLNVQVTVVVTDPFTAHPIWFLEQGPRFIVFSKRVKEFSIARGIPEKSIKVFPFILDEKFTKPLPETLARVMKENLGFDPAKRLVLILGGGDGMPRGKKILRNFVRYNPGIQIAIVCGNNTSLFRKAWQIKAKYNFEALHIFGYIDFVYELINIADVVVTKCGASTFMEILLSGKIPVVNNYIWEQEKGNVEFICQNRMGIYEKDVSKIPSRISELIFNPHIYEVYRENILSQKLENGTPVVSEFILFEQNSN